MRFGVNTWVWTASLSDAELASRAYDVLNEVKHRSEKAAQVLVMLNGVKHLDVYQWNSWQ